MMALGLMAACSTLDCPLNNTVYTKYRLAGNITTLTDTLTISTNRIEGTDSVLINKDVNVDSFILPMSTGVKTTHNSIDSIVINCKEVTYDETKPHFYIYFGHRD